MNLDFLWTLEFRIWKSLEHNFRCAGVRDTIAVPCVMSSTFHRYVEIGYGDFHDLSIIKVTRRTDRGPILSE